MITIEFDMDKYSVTFKGHAQSEETDTQGNDLVCAAISALFYTLAENLERIPEFIRKGSLKKTVGKGDASISCTPIKKYECNVSQLYLFVYNGMQMFEDAYPDSVKVLVR